jgi:hypothetical protein
MEAGAELRCVMWIVALATSATWTAGLPAIVASGAMAGRVTATTACHQGTVIAMTATADLATVLRAGIGHRKDIGPQPAIPRIMADNSLSLTAEVLLHPELGARCASVILGKLGQHVIVEPPSRHIGEYRPSAGRAHWAACRGTFAGRSKHRQATLRLGARRRAMGRGDYG